MKTQNNKGENRGVYEEITIQVKIFIILRFVWLF